MAQAAIALYWLTMALYVVAVVLYVYYFLEKRASFSFYARLLTGVGFIAHTAAIGIRSVLTHGTQLAGPNSLVLTAWALVLVYFVVEHLIKLKVYGVVLIPVATALLLIGQIMGANTATAGITPADLRPLLNGLIGVHVLLVVFANAGFAVAAASSAVYLIQEAQLKSHRQNIMLRRLPSLAAADRLARRIVAWSLPAYAVGLTLGIVRAVETHQAQWWFDPRVMLAGVTFVIFAIYLYLRQRTSVSGRRAAWVTIAGFVLVVVNAVVARTVASGFHIFGQR
jgi:ABC-type transport system involved in cytochrome c biogenesis permease subunit